MNFFDSEIVRNEISEMKELHGMLTFYSFGYSNLESSQRIDLLNQILGLVEKQRIFYFRLSLSDSEDAKEIMERIHNKMSENGWDGDVPSLLDLLEKKINDNLQKEMT